MLIFVFISFQTTRELSSALFAMGIEHQQSAETIDECVLGKTMGTKYRRTAQRTEYYATSVGSNVKINNIVE